MKPFSSIIRQNKIFLTTVIILVLGLGVFSCSEQSTSQATLEPDEPTYQDRAYEIERMAMAHIYGLVYSNNGDENIDTLNDGQRALYVIGKIENAVSNGGFSQFYLNSARKYAPLAPESYKEIDANRCAGLLSEANQIYNQMKEAGMYDESKLDGMLEAYESDAFSHIETEFLKMYENGSLLSLKAQFIMSNFDEIVSRDDSI